METDILHFFGINELSRQRFCLSLGRQRGRVVRAPDLKSGGRGFKSRSDH